MQAISIVGAAPDADLIRTPVQLHGTLSGNAITFTSERSDGGLISLKANV